MKPDRGLIRVSLFSACVFAIGCAGNSGVVVLADAGSGEAAPAAAGDVCRDFGDGGYSGPVRTGEGSDDVRSIRAIHCAAGDTASNLRIELAQTGVESGVFVAHLAQSTPSRADATLCVSATWSGHFFNFVDRAQSFHLRARGLYAPAGDGPGDDNVQLPAASIDTEAIHCAADPND